MIALFYEKGVQGKPYFAVIIVTVSIPILLGAQRFYKISEIQFKRIVLSLLFASGYFY